MTRGKKDHHQ
jgi:hypothetical protein